MEKETGNIAQMFDSIADRYDFLNHFFTLHIDKLWRRKAANELRGLPLDNVLDVATGTADFAIKLHSRLKPKHITGVDISEGMLAIGRKKIEKKGLCRQISLKYGDSTALPFDDQSFDAVTVAFGVRNFEDLEKGLCEMYRVLKIGGKLIILELATPENRVVRVIHNYYTSCILPFFGRFLSSNAKAYKYLPNSVKSFPHWVELKKIMEKCSFDEVKIKSLSFGVAGIYTGTKKLRENEKSEI